MLYMTCIEFVLFFFKKKILKKDQYRVRFKALLEVRVTQPWLM